jgi:CheY-like chemotaxis protein/MinD-like ATPase involved in chromosome partitioning or flagellar assembly
MARKLLVIDDHPETLGVIEHVLQQQGYEVVSTRSGKQGLILAQQERPDLVLVDMMMPEIDGNEVCRRLRADPELTDIPIIMFSAVDEAEQKLAGFDAGADDYLTKPTLPTELVERIATLLEKVPQPTTDETDANTVEREAPEPPPWLRSQSPPGEEAAEESRSGKLIAVIGARGGSGTTTAAINLAATIADTGCPTTLVDLDLTQGHVAFYLNQEVSGGINFLANLTEQEFQSRLPQQLISYNENLKLLLTKPNLDGRSSLLGVEQTAVLSEMLRRQNQCVVVDLGRGVTSMSRPILHQANQVIVCLRPERVALSAARQFLIQLQQTLFPHSALNVLMVDFSDSVKLPQEAVEEFLGHPLVSMIPIPPQEMTQAVNKGVAFVHLYPQMEATGLFYQLAQQFVTT